MTDRPHCQQPDDCQAKGRGAHCRRCHAASPEGRARRAETRRTLSLLHWADPARRAAAVAAAKKGWLCQAEKCLRASHTPEANAKRVESVRQTRFGWCPAERWPEYRWLVEKKRIRPADARQMILDDIAGDAARGRREVARISRDLAVRHEREKAQRFDIFTITIAEEDL